MSKESKHKLSKSTWISILFLTIVIPATLLISWKMGDRKYYLCSVLLIVYAMVPFFLQFEKKKPQPRELVTLAVMCAIVVASRVAFIAVPNFKPMIGILIITGIAFGILIPFLINLGIREMFPVMYFIPWKEIILTILALFLFIL